MRLPSISTTALFVGAVAATVGQFAAADSPLDSRDIGSPSDASSPTSPYEIDCSSAEVLCFPGPVPATACLDTDDTCIDCSSPEVLCSLPKTEAPLAARDITSSPVNTGDKAKRNWCRWRGQSCWKKRDVVAEPKAPLAARDITLSPVDAGTKIKRNWCRWRGQSCWKRDEAAVSKVARSESGDKAKRNWCRWRGQSCWKRDVAADAKVARSESPAAGEKAKRNWCRWRGQSCWKRSENSS